MKPQMKSDQQVKNNCKNRIRIKGDAVLVCDLNGRLLNTSQRASALFKYHKNKILSMTIFDLLPDEHIKRLRTAFKETINKGASNFKITCRKNDMTTFPAEFSLSLIDIEEEKLIRTIVRDIDCRNKKEKELTKNGEKLRELVRDRTLELLEANENLRIEIRVRKQVEKKLLSYQKQLQWLSSQLSIVEEREKRKIASGLHDCIGQTLALAKLKLGLLCKSSGSAELKDSIKEILQLIEQTIKETRTLTFELSPPILYELGLPHAIQWLVDQFAEKYGISIDYKKDNGDMPLDNGIRFTLFQAIRELLVNIVKHSQATKIMLQISTNNNSLKIIVEDNGVGFSSSSCSCTGYGLFNIRERMNHINGHFVIKSKPGAGTRITLSTPFKFIRSAPIERSYYEKNTNFIG